jgi:hypothetical protein
MDSVIKSTGEGGVRISDSPRRSPHITHTVTSPVRSLHPTLHMESLNSQADMPMESLHSQADLGMRTADFFDASSSDGEEDIAGILDREASGVEANLIDRGRHSQTKRRASRPQPVPNEPLVTRCQSKGRSFQPEGDGYQRLLDTLIRRVHQHLSTAPLLSSCLESMAAAHPSILDLHVFLPSRAHTAQ